MVKARNIYIFFWICVSQNYYGKKNSSNPSWSNSLFVFECNSFDDGWICMKKKKLWKREIEENSFAFLVLHTKHGSLETKMNAKRIQNTIFASTQMAHTFIWRPIWFPFTSVLKANFILKHFMFWNSAEYLTFPEIFV